MKAKDLRKKYPKFVYQDYSCKISKNNLELFFDFKIQHYENRSRSIEFKPRILIENVNQKQIKRIKEKIGESAFDNFVFHIGMMEIPSYWKTTCSPKIEIRAGYLNKAQIKWWEDFILNGMGQFFYENKIDFKQPNFLKIVSTGKAKGNPTSAKLTEARPHANGIGVETRPPQAINGKVLIPMGEGKDSITTLETLKSELSVKQLNCFVLNPTKEHFKIFKIAGIKNPIIIKRKIDPALIKLIQKEFLNGHTPITAIVSNLAVFCAALFGYENVAMSCEKSANEGNVEYLGKIINHQYSKTADFEKKFKNYIKKYLTKDINYFNFLRKFDEIQIAKMFSKFSRYFSVFLSCNEARKTHSGTRKPLGKWCNNCSKCLFVFSILYPFLKEKELLIIFHENLFEKKELLPIMKELIGEKKVKPLECVGTKKECITAFYLSWKIAEQRSRDKLRPRDKLPYLLQYFEKKVLVKHSDLTNKK